MSEMLNGQHPRQWCAPGGGHQAALHWCAEARGMSVGAACGDDAGVVWMDIAPAAGSLRAERLRQVVEGVFAQVPQIQSRHRQALAAASATEEGFALAEAWFAFHRRLWETRYSPAIAVLTRDGGPAGEAVDAAAAVATRLSEAH